MPAHSCRLAALRGKTQNIRNPPLPSASASGAFHRHFCKREATLCQVPKRRLQRLMSRPSSWCWKQPALLPPSSFGGGRRRCSSLGLTAAPSARGEREGSAASPHLPVGNGGVRGFAASLPRLPMGNRAPLLPVPVLAHAGRGRRSLPRPTGRCLHALTGGAAARRPRFWGVTPPPLSLIPVPHRRRSRLRSRSRPAPPPRCGRCGCEQRGESVLIFN